MTSSQSSYPTEHGIDYAGVASFKEDLEKNLKFIEDNFSSLGEHRKSFFGSVLNFYRTQDRITDKQINSLLSGWRELLDKEGEVK